MIDMRISRKPSFFQKEIFAFLKMKVTVEIDFNGKVFVCPAG